MPPKKKNPRKTKFLKHDSLSLVAELEEVHVGYTDTYQMCMEKIRAGIHL